MRRATVFVIVTIGLCGCDAMQAIDAATDNFALATDGIYVLGPRDRIHTGMKLSEVWQAYDVDPKKIGRIDAVHEETVGPCTRKTYRYWLQNPQRAQPFLLTFETCKLPNYDEAQEIIRKRREEAYKNNPGLREKADALCKEYRLCEAFSLSAEDGRDVALMMLGYTLRDESTVCTTDFILVRITLDETSIARHATAQRATPSTSLKPDAYGPGIHMNEYGQPVTLRPDFGGVPGERLQIRENAYGPGVHMDQYGRPVREQPWP